MPYSQFQPGAVPAGARLAYYHVYVLAWLSRSKIRPARSVGRQTRCVQGVLRLNLVPVVLNTSDRLLECGNSLDAFAMNKQTRKTVSLKSTECKDDASDHSSHGKADPYHRKSQHRRKDQTQSPIRDYVRTRLSSFGRLYP